MMTRWLLLILIGWVIVPEVGAQFDRSPAPPVPSVPAYPPGRLPANFGAGQNPWNMGPVAGGSYGRPTLAPPPGVIDFQMGGGQDFSFPGQGPQGGPQLVPTPPPPGGVTIYRLYVFPSEELFFTIDFNEAVNLVRAGTHRFEGPAFFLLGQNGPALAPLARGIRQSGHHFLSANPREDNRGRMEVVLGGMQVRPTPGWVPLFEWYLPQKDLFQYTTDPQGELAPALGYRNNGAIGYVIPAR